MPRQQGTDPSQLNDQNMLLGISCLKAQMKAHYRPTLRTISRDLVYYMKPKRYRTPF